MREPAPFLQRQLTPPAAGAIGARVVVHARTGGRNGSAGSIVVLGLLLFAVVWIGELSYASLSPPRDNIEQLTWMHSLQWGYYKHPPLPTWLVWAAVQALGWSAGTSYLCGAAVTLGGLGVVWRLLLRLRGLRYANIALLAALCITRYSADVWEFNHDTVLLLVSAASAALTWHAFSARRVRAWVALGAAIGLGALAKYEVVVTIASLAAFAVHQRAWREPALRRGLCIGALTAALLFAPHLLWLVAHGFPPVRYAIESALGADIAGARRWIESLHWLLDQLLNRTLPASVLLAVTAWPRLRGRMAQSSVAAVPTDSRRALLLAWGLVPLAFVPLMGVVTGAHLPLHWGTPFLLFVVPALMELTPRARWQAASMQRAVAAFALIQLASLALYHVTSVRGPVALRNAHWRAFDAAQLEQRIAAPARAALHGPIRLVSGPVEIAGSLALRLPERPLVLIDGRLERSPWVPASLPRECGVLEVGPIAALPGGQPVGPGFAGLAWRVTAPLARTLAGADCRTNGAICGQPDSATTTRPPQCGLSRAA